MPIDDNVDLDEIAKFEKLASRWWDPNSEFKPLHDINPLRAGWIDQHAGVNGKSVLDVGCGTGILSMFAAQALRHGPNQACAHPCNDDAAFGSLVPSRAMPRRARSM